MNIDIVVDGDVGVDVISKQGSSAYLQEELLRKISSWFWISITSKRPPQLFRQRYFYSEGYARWKVAWWKAITWNACWFPHAKSLACWFFSFDKIVNFPCIRTFLTYNIPSIGPFSMMVFLLLDFWHVDFASTKPLPDNLPSKGL